MSDPVVTVETWSAMGPLAKIGTVAAYVVLWCAGMWFLGWFWRYWK